MKCLADMESGVIWRSGAVGQPGGRIRQTHRNYVAKKAPEYYYHEFYLIYQELYLIKLHFIKHS